MQAPAALIINTGFERNSQLCPKNLKERADAAHFVLRPSLLKWAIGTGCRCCPLKTACQKLFSFKSSAFLQIFLAARSQHVNRRCAANGKLADIHEHGRTMRGAGAASKLQAVTTHPLETPPSQKSEGGALPTERALHSPSAVLAQNVTRKAFVDRTGDGLSSSSWLQRLCAMLLC